MKFEPLYDRILVKRSSGLEVSEGGIFVPETARGKRDEGTVVAVGKGKRADDGSLGELTVKVGDKVRFMEKLVIEVEDGEDKYLVMPEEAVLVIIH